MQESLIEEKKRTPKFENQKGVFWLEGVKITWKLEDSYCSMYHFDFSSGKIPNLISETGYRSHFEDDIFLERYDSIKNYLINLVEYFINVYNVQNKKNKKITYRLEFEDTGYKPKKQFTLIEMKGGNK